MTTEITALLQECDALKARLSSLRPLPVEALKKIEEAYNIEYTYESNRIEGNTLTLQETELVVNEGVTISGKSMREHLEAINHAEAIDYIRDFAKSDVEISERTIKQIQALVLHGINRENAGRYRSVPVRISGSTHAAPAVFVEQANGKFHAALWRTGSERHTPCLGCRFPARSVGAHTSVYRRQRAHIAPFDELIPFAPRLHHRKPKRRQRNAPHLLRRFGSLLHRPRAVPTACHRGRNIIFEKLSFRAWL